MNGACGKLLDYNADDLRIDADANSRQPLRDPLVNNWLRNNQSIHNLTPIDRTDFFRSKLKRCKSNISSKVLHCHILPKNVKIMEYTTIKNGVDARLSIICHNESGFYNITKTAKLVYKLKCEVGRNSCQPTKPQQPSVQHERGPRVNQWFSNNQTKELFQACGKLLDYNADDLRIDVSTGPNDYRGTYVHPDLYDHFIAWIDPQYALLISMILKKYHAEANKKVMQEKDDKIDQLLYDNKTLLNKLDKQSEKIDQQSDEIRELLGYAKQTTSTLHEVQDTLTETKEEIKLAKTYLEEKSFTSTKNPSDKKKHHYFGATTYFVADVQHVKFVSGQKSYVDRTIHNLIVNDKHKIIIKPFYNANGIDLRQNAHEEFGKRRSERIKHINIKNALVDLEFNENLKKEIRVYNKANPENKRRYSSEKQTTRVVKVGDISIKFSKLSFTYNPNPYITFVEVLQIIKDVNGITQESPLSSDTE
jgi:hypothetical protein